MAPEQTGRINRGIDYRTDYYSLGVTFYQLLTGQLPFQYTDPVELIHAHIALMPVAPHSIDSKIPQILSDIVMKLLAKPAEDRYQSIFGLCEDLKKCLVEFNNTGKILPFKLGASDIYNQFQIPEKLYGRTEEIKQLFTVYNRAMQGSAELMLIGGEPGIGKSSVVQETASPVVQSTANSSHQ